jgi:ribosomal protein L11 methyltransferase
MVKTKSMRAHQYEINMVLHNADCGASEIVRTVLVSAGFKNEAICETDDGERLSFRLYVSTASEAETIIQRLKKVGLAGLRVSRKCLRNKDWMDAWKRNIRPFSLTPEIMVVPVWLRKARKVQSRKEIFLDSTLAFGTGLHETTRFMAELIRIRRGKFYDFFDVGTGTGILSMVAIFYGAKKVDAIDIDAECIRVAKENLARNGMSFARITAGDFAKSRLSTQYDFVAANLITFDLLAVKDQLSTTVKTDGYLAVSGISLENYQMFRAGFKTPQLKCVKILKGKQWVALLYKKEVAEN